MKSLCFLLLISSSPLFAQINLQQFPKSLQLYPRDVAVNTARVQISGTAAPSPDSLIFSLEKSTGAVETQAFAMNDLIGQQFDLSFEIQAGLWSYSIKAEIKSANTTVLLREATNVVAGDVFVVQGQSNAQAVAYNGDANIWQNNFIRCFGDPNPANFADQNWYIADGNGYFTPGAIGQWALRLGYLIQENLQIPVAIINGADPGKPIEFFQRNDTLHTDPNTNYGRLLQRLNNAGVSDRTRALVYYQGESDGDRAEIHKTLFEALHADWEENIANTEAYYVVQVREGCGAPSLQLREYQKDFQNYLHNTKAVTANGIDGHDGCHYNLLGYKTLGEKIYKQLSADLYNTPTGEQTNIQVLSAFFSNDLNTQITVITDVAGGLNLQPGCAYDFKITGASASVIGAQADGNNLILNLDQSVSDPNAGLSYGGHAGSDAWVLNGFGYGLFTFYNLPIGNHHVVPNFDIPGIMSGSGNCVSLDGVNDYLYVGPVLKSSYTKEAWINWQGGSTLNNIVSGGANTAFWAPNGVLAAGHNGAWGQVTDNVTMIPNQWTHVAVSYDATLEELRLYKNGKLVSQAQNVPAHNDPEVFIGAFVGCCTFQGKIDEVRVWDTVRTMEEIRANMCQKLKGTEPGLTAYFRFDETSGANAPNAIAGPGGQLTNFDGLGLNQAWQRSGAPIGTKSAQTYQQTNHLELSISSGDSLVLSTPNISDFAHLYFTEEVPNVLQPADGFTVVDNARYFGIFYPNQSIVQYELKYFYAGNPLAFVQEQNNGLLKRRNNAQSYWEQAPQFLISPAENSLTATGTLYQEYILAIKDSAVVNPLSAQLDVVQTLQCNGINDGVINTTVLGGQSPYAYSLNGGSPQSSGLFTGLPSGNYVVSIMDQAGNAFTTNMVSLQSPNPLLVSVQVTGNSASVTVEGGIAPYTQTSNAPNQDLQNLPNGAYLLLVTDANGCATNASFIIDYQPLTLDAILLDINPCDQLADLVAIAQGGEPPYQFSLNNGVFQSSNTFQDLSNGTYTVLVLDAFGQSEALSTVEINVPGALFASAAVSGETITVTSLGGVPPYTYSLNGAPPQSTGVFTNLNPGAYSITVTDAAGCTTTATGTILSPLSMTVSVNDMDFCDGFYEIIVLPGGGQPPYLYSLNNGPSQTDGAFFGLLTGIYFVHLVDALGQVAPLISVEFVVPHLLEAVGTVVGGSVFISTSGGVEPYAFSLDGGVYQSDSVFTGLVPGDYSIDVKDVWDCITTVPVTIVLSGTFTPNQPWDISVAPNPGSGLYHIESKNAIETLNLTVWDLTGNQLQSARILATENTSAATLDLSAEPDGIYILRISDGRKFENIRLAKIK